MAANFQEDLKRGKAGEEAFILKHPWKLVPSGVRTHDFDGPGGLKIELKSDHYGFAKSPNFFMERWSNLETQKPGGPWQSHLNGVDIFIYSYVDGPYYEFKNVGKLVLTLDELTATMKPLRIVNRGWITTGYKVQRDLLTNLFDHYE